MKDGSMKEKPVPPLLVSMALSMTTSVLVSSLYNIVDSFFAARISERATTALSFVYLVQNLVNAVAIGYGVGINALTAPYSGAGDKVSVDTAAIQGFSSAAIHGILTTVGSVSIMPVSLHMFTSDEGVIELGIQCSTIVFMFPLVIMMGLSSEGMLQSVGRIGTVMIGMPCGCIPNTILGPLLIFEVGFSSKTGIAGVAWATEIGQVITSAVYILMYLARPIPVHIGRNYLEFNRSMGLELHFIGTPATLGLTLPSLLVSSLNGILALCSQNYVVTLGIYYKLQAFLYLPANGIVQGTHPIIGCSYDIGEHKRVRRIYDTTFCMSCIIMVLGIVLCLTAPKQLISLFTSSSEAVLSGQKALHITSTGSIALSVFVTSLGALEGPGKGAQSLITSLFQYAMIVIPAAFILCRIWGPVGVWSAFWTTEFITATVPAAVHRLSIKSRQTNQSKD